ncbi:RNA-binding domain-containing protein, partial [Microstroma glucosiphilum]
TSADTGASRGWGIARFSAEADRNRALVEMQGIILTPSNGTSPGRPLRVSVMDAKTASPILATLPSPSSALDPNNTTVFVGGLSSLISEETLKTFFSPFGAIAYVKIPPGKGCGFVSFLRKVDAERAIERMQGFPIGGSRIRLSWGRSQGEKNQQLAQMQISQLAN